MIISFVIPCLNEAETLAIVIRKCFQSLSKLQVEGEIIIADNGSEDGSPEIARSLGAVVVNVPERGYGAAIMAGIEAAQGKYIVMGDADDSYSLDAVAEFYSKLEDGFDLVMGNRFRGGIEEGAMPWLHKYLGNPVLSRIGRTFFQIPVGDFHCGLRAFRRDSIMKIQLKSSGMEFASEMVVKAALNQLSIVEVPTRLSRDGRSRRPHLRTWRDGWRHLAFLLAASPRWLFLYPALVLIGMGSFGSLLTVRGELHLGGISLSTNAFFLFLSWMIVGIQILLFSILARVFSSKFGFLPRSRNISLFERFFSLERGVLLGSFLTFVSLVATIVLLFSWRGRSFEIWEIEEVLRITGFIILGTTVGIQVVFASFFAALLQA
jgi:glycosyltransferase involved in cell wall biosynthesis